MANRSRLLYNLQTRIKTNVEKRLGVEYENGCVYYDSDFEELLIDAKVEMEFRPNGAHFRRGSETLLLPYQNRPNRHGDHLIEETLIRFFP